MTVGELAWRTGPSIKAIRRYEALGLTIKEIDQVARGYLGRPGEPIGPQLAALLERAERRIDERTAELDGIRSRIREYRANHAAALAGERGVELFEPDPRRRRAT